MTKFVAHVIPEKDLDSDHSQDGIDCKCRPNRSAESEYGEFTIRVFEHKSIRGFRKHIPWLNWDRVGLATMSVVMGYTLNDAIDSGFLFYILGIR